MDLESRSGRPHHRAMRTPLLPLLVLAALAACSSSTEAVPAPPAAREAAATGPVAGRIDEIVATYGGPYALRRLASSRVVGSVEPHIRDMGGSGRMERELAAPDRLRVEIAYPAQTEIRIVDGERGWRGIAPDVRPVDGPPLLAMTYQLLRVQPAWALDRHRDRVRDGGRRSVDGAEREILTLAWSPELELDFAVEPATHRITRVDGRLQLGPTAMAFATTYSDFRVIDGVLVPFQEESYAMSRRTATLRIASIDLGATDLGPFGERP